MTASSIAGLPSRHTMAKTGAHRRESSLSTNTSSCSSQTTRVLPFATAFTTRGAQPLYMPSGQAPRRFAVARPRRVVTDSSGGVKASALQPPRLPVNGRRHSAAIGIGGLLPAASGSRTRAIIGLGLTLNPADAVVRLQPRHAAQSSAQAATRSLGSIKQRQEAQLSSPAIKATEPKEPKDLSPGLSLFASPQPSLAPSAESHSHSPRNSDPQPVSLQPTRGAPSRCQDAPVAEWIATPSPPSCPTPCVAEVPSVEDLQSFVSCTSSVSPEQPRLPQTPVTGAVSDITCLMCFERVLITTGRTRGHAMRCPSCYGSLSVGRLALTDGQGPVMRARNSVHIMQSHPSSLGDPPPPIGSRRSGDSSRKSKHTTGRVAQLLHRRRPTHRRRPAAPTSPAVPPPLVLSPQLLPRRQSSRHARQAQSNHRRQISTTRITSRKTPSASGSPPHSQTRALLHLPTTTMTATLHLERPMFLPASAQSSGTYNEAKVSESLGTIQLVEHSPSSSRTLNSERRGKSRNRKDDGFRKPIEPGIQTLTVATFLGDGDAAAYADRCATHPGSRNDLWCETCEAAICSHCVSPATGSHRAHVVVKLAAAYDDTFEAIEALQLDLVGHLGETRQRNALLDEASAAVAEEFSAAMAVLDLQARRDTKRIEIARERAESELVRHSDECMGWRKGLEGALSTVQRMVEELAPAQAVAERSRIERMLGAAAAARPSDWADDLPLPRIVDQAMPSWRYSTLYVTAVAELGRRRGHVHVLGDPFSAHGALWQARVSRSRTNVGEPSLALSITCVEGPSAKRVFSVSASIAAVGIELTYSGEWTQKSEHVFSLCLLESIAPALDGDGALSVRVGVQPESYRELALAQESRIEDLEGRLRGLQEELAAAKAEAASLSADASMTARRRRSEARGWATSPRALPVPQIPLPEPPTLPAAGVEGSQHRRAASLTAKLRRQPPIPFPISTVSSEQQQPPPSSPPAGSLYSQSSGLSDEKGSMMRRLSGWVRTRQSRALPRPEKPSDDVGGDWTFLDRTLSPGFEQLSASAEPLRALTSSASASPLSMRIGRRPLSLWPSRGLINVSPPLVPAPMPLPLPLALPEQQAQQLGDAKELADGFAFDGVADIEREQALVDARAERRAQAVLTIEDKYTSLAQRLDKIQLIANTCENSRDGYSEGTLRRISSELGVLMGSRRRQRTEAAGSPMRRAALDASDLFSDPGSDDDEDSLCLSPLTGRQGRRAVTMDSRELSRAIERSVALGSPDEDVYEISVSPTPVRRYEMAVSRRTSNSSVSSASSAGGGGRSSGRITRPGGGSQRRGSITGESPGILGLSPAITPSKLGTIQNNGSQLTPRANRQGGILKAGRTMRAKPGRLHTLAEVAGEISAPVQPWVEQPPSSPVTRVTRSSSIADDDGVREVSGRPARPNRPLRKSVRFPEELRLLETIRLIDPRAAQTIENRAVSVYEPLNRPLPSDDDEPEPPNALAARIRYSPRLAPKRASLDVEALSLDEAVDHLLLDAPQYARPPLPPRGCLELGLSRQRRNSTGRGAQNQRDSFVVETSSSRLVWGAGRGSIMCVGPNVASAQSSPLDVDPVGPAAAGSVSSLESAEGLVAGATHSAHLYPSELAAFGDAQIPAIACGRDTAFRASELGLMQGPDMKTK
ncbi:hypothetical protein IW152_003389 [Coemansia sp. BCRC 34962]|nr:hypothetical protein IW152_003389 [Coemansia sp. BCRC 34962]